MKKLCLAAITSLLLPNMSYAAACADGENADGCTISTSDITYTLTGNISTSGGMHRAVSLPVSATRPASTGNITPQGLLHTGCLSDTSDSNTTNLTGNITTTGDRCIRHAFEWQ